MKDEYKERANVWDDNPWKQKFTEKIYQFILKNIVVSNKTRLLDLGGGTGLLALKFTNNVKDITVVDTSKGMLDVLKNKIKINNLKNVKIINDELLENVLPFNSVDLVISAMALHHIKDIKEQFKVIYNILSQDGNMAFVDLVAEDGGFHTEGSDYIHNGFEEKSLINMLKSCNFKDIKLQEIEVVEKINAFGKLKKYPLFIVIASK